MTAAAVGAVEGSVIQAISDTDTSDQFERGRFITKPEKVLRSKLAAAARHAHAGLGLQAPDAGKH